MGDHDNDVDGNDNMPMGLPFFAGSLPTRRMPRMGRGYGGTNWAGPVCSGCIEKPIDADQLKHYATKEEAEIGVNELEEQLAELEDEKEALVRKSVTTMKQLQEESNKVMKIMFKEQRGNMDELKLCRAKLAVAKGERNGWKFVSLAYGYIDECEACLLNNKINKMVFCHHNGECGLTSARRKAMRDANYTYAKEEDESNKWVAIFIEKEEEEAK